ncbi:cytokine receptor common subunit gamma isoform X1 [Python bivittatus]|uniref:Cytokine receptor common subunit gamma isoform X1 n=1 Tax=Python bivittatus TaxID=176946 RepID=A0A9F5MY48_PYTBI|nr:cytokine receptor common subunit gamma isoform X1 [Python bivittatus]XP_025021068.1 cytokine receptor common subunit gamma isoform X1 [Python bivittatus]XP_025021069.1 cytokine receptor common subunit gamma isoform X1 [Python bivittatus]XP_025021070.1 cytokine receptor common subunit gamma isoform X1 [Python bivittatus]
MRASGCLGVAFGLLLLLVDPGEPTAGSSQPKVECICHNGDYVICDWGSEQMPDTNYSFYFWYEGINDPVEECKDYTQMFGLNVACRFSKYKPFNHLRTYINGSQGRIIPTESLLLNDLVRPGPPFNLTFHNLSNHQLLLTWKSPYKRPMCLQHAVSYKSNKDTHWMEHHVNSMAFQIPSVDPEKLYTFYVKSKLHNNCASTKLWSQPSEFVLWGKEDASPLPLSPSLLSIVIPLGSFFVLLMLLLALVWMERVWVILMPRIPNPSKKFEDLFTAYQGNFSEWAGVSKDAVESFKPNYFENICSVTELLPSGGYLSVSSDVTVKTGGAPGLSADLVSKVHPDAAALTA